MRGKPKEFSDPVRKLVHERLRAVRVTMKEASAYVGRNQSYLHQFLLRGSPRILPEEVRHALASLLGVPEGSLRSGLPLPPPPRPEAGGALSAVPTQDIPVFREQDVIEPALATEWIGRPPLLGASGPVFALWIGAPHCPRLRPGDLAVIRINQPARPGDLVTVLVDKRVVAVGEFAANNLNSVAIQDGGPKPVEVTDANYRVLKIACVVLP